MPGRPRRDPRGLCWPAPGRPRRAVLAAALLLAAAPGPVAAQQAPGPAPIPGPAQVPGRSLGQIPADYEVHGELILVSGQLEGFFEACGFGRKPDRDELMRWYEHYRLARSMGRIQGIYDLGVALGREGPCTTDHHTALVRQWQTLLSRTLAYVDAYRR
ncbi:hypothetical protein [Rhodospirillum centenum]|uniref:Secreted protein n=1 Tax=Rhodospirillum centenum (strain ATCC 51521 / SW) TaxID=414684 RepID=B6IUA3_RHOCS|nr:hypothetical protein [Rhodospirillum centenum]ACI99980.1 hypothetical protein RC1_2600 [Rhodospirillum centenum SW]